ncbi:TraX family protein [Peptoniphilus equinus]|uniref:TraX family protein n=1 Tax=Peptoniphilus equinus TaxID=3016343 RepID=A0ABY7QS92_9FIRM|nr:TraX family protein [Peptoniphilus equinus]WBW49654.1 TraX family protein [Peptoniphilus equinus]
MSSSTLKLIGILSMMIDHSAVTLFRLGFLNAWFGADSFKAYEVMRMMGRWAFPIFLFLLVEGFYHTRSVPRFASRLVIFAVISEVFFDYALFGALSPLSNVYFELALAVGMFAAFKWLGAAVPHKVVRGLLMAAVAVAIGLGAEFIHADYGINGIVAAAIFYVLRCHRKAQAVAVIPAFYFEGMPFTFLVAPLLYAYNGKRGLPLKYVFYAFYPVHLALLSLLEFIY